MIFIQEISFENLLDKNIINDRKKTVIFLNKIVKQVTGGIQLLKIIKSQKDRIKQNVLHC